MSKLLWFIREAVSVILKEIKKEIVKPQNVISVEPRFNKSVYNYKFSL